MSASGKGTKPGGGLALELPPDAAATFLERAAAIVTEMAMARVNVDPEPWIGVKEAAEHIGAKRQRIYDLVSEGTLEPARDGSRLLFKRSWLDAYVEAPR